MADPWAEFQDAPAQSGPVAGPPPSQFKVGAERRAVQDQVFQAAADKRAQEAADRDAKVWAAKYNEDGTLKEGGGKPVPVTLQNKLTDNFSIFQSMDNAARQFQPDFAGNTVTGEAENWAQAMSSGVGTPGQREWWSAFRQADNLIRNQMYGSALTDTEKRAYEQTTVSPSMDPKIITANIGRRRDIIKSALSRQARALGAAGYNKEEIAILLGDDPSFLEPPAGANPDALTPERARQTYDRELQNYRADVADLPPKARQIGEQKFNSDPRINSLLRAANGQAAPQAGSGPTVSNW